MHTKPSSKPILHLHCPEDPSPWLQMHLSNSQLLLAADVAATMHITAAAAAATAADETSTNTADELMQHLLQSDSHSWS
jgi:hypothetical protein